MIKEFDTKYIKPDVESIYVCAGGFEDRVLGIINKFETKTDLFRYSLILEYNSHKNDNEYNKNIINSKLLSLSKERVINIQVDIDNPFITKQNLKFGLKQIDNKIIKNIYIDISGMANFLILIILKFICKYFNSSNIFVLYSEAKVYYPHKREVKSILNLANKKSDESIIKLGEILQASGARDVLIPTEYRGDFQEDLPTALIFLVGYEPARDIGLLESYRPNLVIPCYGSSPHKKFNWRTKFSIDLHKNFGVFEKYYGSKENQIISTFNVDEIVQSLDIIYQSQIEGIVLYEGFNIAITPQCSKLQALATYIFSETHPDVQIVFCLPGKYNPRRYSGGIGKSWIYEIQPYSPFLN